MQPTRKRLRAADAERWAPLWAELIVPNFALVFHLTSLEIQ
jgi:hypothetical protein